jgi:uncharacterized small protein (DUF1192 family)
MTEQRIKELRGICEEATKGKWMYLPDGNGAIYRVADGERMLPVLFSTKHGICGNDSDLDFITEARAAVPELLDEIARLTAELAAVTRERDAAVRDMQRLAHGGEGCEVCKQYVDNGKCCADCDDCGLECYCRTCRNSNKWEWRGAVAAPRVEPITEEQAPSELC